MAEDIKKFIKDFMSALQVARIYEIEHPKFIEAIESSYSSLDLVLAQKNELIIGIFGDELASENEIFFDLSKKITQPISSLKDLGIEKISFKRGVTKEELIKFISFLIAPKDTDSEDLQKYLSFLGITHIQIGKVKAYGSNAADYAGDSPSSRLDKYKSSLDDISGFLYRLMDGDSLNYLSLQFIANDVMENLMGNYQLFFKLAKTRNRDNSTFIHLLNVSALAVYFSDKLGFNRADTLSIGIAALFHDIGKLYIEKKIIQKSGTLDEEEFDRMKSHTVLGAEILLKYVDTLTALPLVVAFEHHLGYDCKGYPKFGSPRKIHVASLIVSICDVYDALTQRRSYKRDYPPMTIYKIMMKERGRKFEPVLLDEFFKNMGVWPNGTIVRLNDDRIAIVREQNYDYMLSPHVEVIAPDKREMIDLEKKADIKIVDSLNPLGEGSKYVGLI